MKKRIIAVLLTLCLCLGLIPTAFAAGDSLESSVDLNQLVAHAKSMYAYLEAGNNYGSVVQNDSGAVGMGILGWRGSKAAQLLKLIIAADPVLAEKKLGAELYEEVLTLPTCGKDQLVLYSLWGSRSFTPEEAEAASALLSTPIGMDRQDYLARLDILEQARAGWASGIRSEAALIYFCSVQNHYGPGGASSFLSNVRQTLGISESTTINSLEELHQGVLLAAEHYSSIKNHLNYRIKVYNYLTKNLGLDPGEAYIPVQEHFCPSAKFTDVPPEGNWAHEGIDWAVANGITKGSTETSFAPDRACSRGEVVTFLWRAAGQPEPGSSVNPFRDVRKSDYFYTAVLWAVEKGVTKGVSADRFAPADTCTRGQVVTFLWRACGKPEPRIGNSFRDVDAASFYFKAVLWAVEMGITKGDTATTFAPESNCTRAHVVTFLYRAGPAIWSN